MSEITSSSAAHIADCVGKVRNASRSAADFEAGIALSIGLAAVPGLLWGLDAEQARDRAVFSQLADVLATIAAVGTLRPLGSRWRDSRYPSDLYVKTDSGELMGYAGSSIGHYLSEECLYRLVPVDDGE